MSTRKTALWIVLAGLLAAPAAAFADGQADLVAGQKALQAGQVDQAIELLAAAAQALPQSVDAQLALARARLSAGQFDKALDQHRIVLRLSPEHAEAKRMVEALAGQRKTFEQKLALARTMMDVGLHAAAVVPLCELVGAPHEPAQRLAARMLLAEAMLWQEFNTASLAEILRAVNEAAGTPSEPAARVMAAMSLVTVTTPANLASAEQMLKTAEAAGPLPAPWKQRAELVRLLIAMKPPTVAADVTKRLSSLPPSGYRNELMHRMVIEMCTQAGKFAARGQTDVAVQLLVPLITAEEMPAAPASRGWVPKTFGRPYLDLIGRDSLPRIAPALAEIGARQFAAARNLQSFRLAGEFLNAVVTEKPGEAWAVESWLNLTNDLAAYSRPAPDRRKGEPLSPADTLQAEMIVQLAPHLASDAQYTRLLAAVYQQIARYEAAGDLGAGLAQFVRRPADGDDVVLSVPAGATRQTLLGFLADKFAQVGAETFAKAAASLDPQAVRFAANPHDQAAVALYRRIAVEHPGASQANNVNRIIDRYASADKWDDARAVVTAFYAGQSGDAPKWAELAFRVRVVIAEENKQLAARRALGNKLSPAVADALASAVKIVQDNPTQANKAHATNLASTFVQRYSRLDRADLAGAVLASLGGELADWALLARARLLAQQANVPLAQAAAGFNGVDKIALQPGHAEAMKLLAELIEKYPNSPHAMTAVNEIVAIANSYKGYQAYDVAGGLLSDLVKTHPNIKPVERLRFEAVQVALAKAANAFEKRPDKTKPPEAISPEYAAALKALAEFIKQHPAGQYAQSAENQFVEVARVYGNVGAWPVVREAIKQFAAAVPDIRQPERIKLMEAATYLGELDRSHGLSLLAAPPVVTLTDDVSGWTDSDGRVWHTLRDRRSGGGGNLEERRESAGAQPSFAIPPATTLPLVINQPADTGYSGRADRSADALLGEIPGRTLAAIRQGEAMQMRRIAVMEQQPSGKPRSDQSARQLGENYIILPSGPVLSEAEMKRQDAAADAAYAILIGLVGKEPGEVAALARNEVLWLFGFFEGQLRHNRAAALIERFIKNQPGDPERLPLAYRTINDKLVWAGQRQGAERIDQAWIDARHGLFESARTDIRGFIEQYAKDKVWVGRAKLLVISSYEQEAALASAVSAPRAGGLLARAADELLKLADDEPDHSDAANFPARLWSIADRLIGLRQTSQAVYVLGRIPIRFPTHDLAIQSVMRTAQLYADNLSAPLRAVETYQEYLALAGDNEPVRAQIFSIAQQLAGRQRYIEALHVYNVFVDSFPGDGRAPQALFAAGQIHQSNEAWNDAIAAYQRVLIEYPSNPIGPQVRLAIADCDIQLSRWRAARRIYEDYLAGRQDSTIQQKIETLKSLDRYQTLLADAAVTRNKDDAQFQIGRIVLERLGNRVKAIEEFAKVVSAYPKSDLADDAQFEIGKALMALGRLDEARAALWRVPREYPTSPLADDALYQIGQSYERQAERLASITKERAKELAFESGQRDAYKALNIQLSIQSKESSARRQELKAAGNGDALELDEAYGAFRYNYGDVSMSQFARKAEITAETESALEVASRQDRINEAYRNAVAAYAKAAEEYKLGDMTDESLLRMAQIFEVHLRDRKAAMETYQQVVKFFPGTPVAEDAAWKVAKFHELEGNYDEAVKAYREFIRNYPASPQVADAQYAMAEALEQLGRWVEAMDAYQTFRDKFAGHPKAPAAEQQIQWIKAYRR